MKKDLPKAKPLAGSINLFNVDFIIEVLLLGTIFFTTVIFDRRLGIVFSGTKIAWLRALVIIILGVWAIKLIVAKEHRFMRTALDWPILTFLASTTVATLTSVHAYTSFVGFYGRFEGLSTWYILGLLFFITINYIHSFEQLKRIIAVVIPAAVLMSIYSIIQRHELDPYMWGGVVTKDRVIGTIGQPNFLAAYILMAFFLAMVLFFEEKNYSREIDWFGQLPPISYFLFSQIGFIVMIYFLEAQDIFLWYSGFALITAAALLFAYNYEKLHPLILDSLLGISLLLFYICLLYTQSRGGYMGYSTGSVLFALVAGRRWLFKNWIKLAVIIILIILFSGITIVMRPEYSPFQRFTAEITTKKEEGGASEAGERLELKGAAGSRGETWKSAFKIIADYPIFGIGPEVLKMVFPRYETELFRFKEAFHVKQDRCHNETFDVPVTKGMISFFLYLWIIFTVFKVGFNKLRSASPSQKLMLAGILAACLAYLVQNQFSFGVIAITSLFWVMWGMVMVLGEEKQPAKPQKLSLAEVPWLSVAGVVVIGGYLIYVSFLSFRGDIYFKSGKTYLETRNIPQAIEGFHKSLKVYPLEGTAVSHLAIAYLNLGKMDEAINLLKYGTLIDPYNADNYFMLSKVYLSFYDHGAKEAIKDSIANAEIALKIDPYYAEAYEIKGQIFERQGKINEAAQMYEKTFWINPTLATAIQEIEGIYRKLGEIDQARKIFEKAADKYPDNIEIFKALERSK